MSKNLIPEICKMLGVELGEEFKIKGDNKSTYKFAYDELLVSGIDDKGNFNLTANMTLVSLLQGKREIIKLPWKPKEGEFYYSFGIFAQTWGVSKICWLQHPFDFALLAKGWVYRTKEEAKAALPKVAAEMGVDYEL